MSGMAEIRAALADGPLEVTGRLVAASNATLLCSFESANGPMRCVYKPTAGERPLWDFPEGTLGRREVATAVISEALSQLTGSTALVPPTIWREVGPFGPGMCQLWIEDAGGTDVDIVPRDEVPDGWLTSVAGIDGRHQEVLVVHQDQPDLRQLALFDLVINNADRKGGHILRDPSGRLYAIDHGVTMHVDEKLRTVLWGWGGREFEPAEVQVLGGLRDGLRSDLGKQLASLLHSDEIGAMARRLRHLLRSGRFPEPNGDWPAIPWPVF